MPLYIVHTRSAQHVNCRLWTVDKWGYGRARAWRTRIMRISPKSFTYVFALLWGDKSNGAEAHSSGELKFSSSQTNAPFALALLDDANTPRRVSEYDFRTFGADFLHFR